MPTIDLSFVQACRLLKTGEYLYCGETEEEGTYCTGPVRDCSAWRWRVPPDIRERLQPLIDEHIVRNRERFPSGILNSSGQSRWIAVWKGRTWNKDY
jgi:hypothetical protein